MYMKMVYNNSYLKYISVDYNNFVHLSYGGSYNNYILSFESCDLFYCSVNLNRNRLEYIWTQRDCY